MARAARVRYRAAAPALLPPPTPTALWAVRARSIYRKSRADEGRLGVWLVMATSAEEAEETWRGSDGVDLWVYQNAVPHERGNCVRIF